MVAVPVVQFAAAPYFPGNFDARPGHKLSCPVSNCPFVERADMAGFLALYHANRAIVLAFRRTASIRNRVVGRIPF